MSTTSYSLMPPLCPSPNHVEASDSAEPTPVSCANTCQYWAFLLCWQGPSSARTSFDGAGRRLGTGVSSLAEHRKRDGLANRVTASSDEALLCLCSPVAVRLQLLASGQDSRALLLDLGRCTADEAVLCMQHLLGRLASDGLRGRIGISSTGTMAQIAQITQSSTPVAVEGSSLAVLDDENRSTCLSRLPLGRLLELYPRGFITTETIDRLHRYGLRTLAQVCQLAASQPNLMLRQFGPRVGPFLVDLATTHEVGHFTPWPVPPRVRARLRFASAADPDRVLGALPAFCAQAAGRLAADHRATGRLRLVLHYASGERQSDSWSLRQATDQSRVLEQEIRRRLLAWFACALHRQMRVVDTIGSPKGSPGRGDSAEGAAAGSDVGEELDHISVDELHLHLEALQPVVPEQGVVWLGPDPARDHAHKRAAIQEVAQVLTDRYPHGSGASLVRLSCTQSEAIFPAERYSIHPVASAASVSPAQARSHLAARLQRAYGQGDTATEAQNGSGN